MNGDENISGISRFGRLRKISTKLRDFPSIAQRTSKRKTSSHSNPKSLAGKVKPKRKSEPLIDPFADFEPETFINLLSSAEDTTDTSSSSGENDEHGVMRDPLSGVEFELHNDSQRVYTHGRIRKTLPLQPTKRSSQRVPKVDVESEKFNDLGMSEDSTDTSSSKDDENVASSEFSDKVKTRQRTVNRKTRGKKQTDQCTPSRQLDCGQSKCNAYSLWAKEARSKLMANHPRWRKATVSRQLREMWEKVPSSRKTTFERKAALVNSNIKMNSSSGSEDISPPIEIIWVASKY
ncbi:uncharacterized protein LOC119085275 [Bradysia coprophila]|uniref:uncharacterized protein LOC119085275 n=1 Tax=Bradysia coprophila TaxID=38358 RepID=UPI00187D86A3|nr:uncharacterized protein LOC119085275 [Bradysia coprophila]